MRKYLINILLVLLTICLFVGCSSSPKEDELPQSVSYNSLDTFGTITFYKNGTFVWSYAGITEPTAYCFGTTLSLTIGVSQINVFGFGQTPITSKEQLFNQNYIAINDAMFSKEV